MVLGKRLKVILKTSVALILLIDIIHISFFESNEASKIINQTLYLVFFCFTSL